MYVDTYFQHMAGSIYGTKSIKEEMPEQFGKYFSKPFKTKSSGTSCTHCGVGIPVDIHNKANTMECPCCGKNFVTKIKKLTARKLPQTEN